jgi:hypothetical protein
MSRFVSRVALAVLAVFGLAEIASAQNADLILRNGRIFTVDSGWRIVEAVAIRDGRFVAVGSNDEVGKLAGS